MKLCDKVFRTIVAHRKGWVFSPSDLTHKFTRKQVNNALYTLLKSGKIRRIARGIYDYPSYSEFLGEFRSPNINEVRQTLARKYKWKTEIFSEYALNYFHLSTQVVAKNVYMSSGPTTKFTLFDGTTLEFESVPLKTINFKYRISTMIVQALRALGKNHIDDEVIAKIREQIQPNMRAKIINDTKNTTAWIYKAVTQVCRN